MSTLHIYMKSGNVINLHFVKSWKVEVNGNTVTHLTIKVSPLAQFFYSQRLIVSSIALDQIEAITES